MAIIRNERPLTHERLLEVLQYDAEDGLFFWRQTISPRATAGSIAGTVRKDGYRMICLDGEQYKAARLAWYYVHGVWPDGYVDHESRNRADDRIENLRPTSLCENAWNTGITTRNTSGYKGVCFSSRLGLWVANITNEGQARYLGSFKEAAEAHAAYCDAANKSRGAIGAVV